MKIKDVYYRRLVSFRDEDGPHNEVLGATAEVDPEIESPEECGEKLIEWVEEELKVRMTLRESTVALRVRADMLRDQVDSLCDRHARMFSRVEEVLALHDKEIYGYGWDDDDLPF